MDEGYTHEDIKILDQMEPPRRPWRLKYEYWGTWPGDDLPDFHREVESIFENMPELPSLTIHFEGGKRVDAFRDFFSDHMNSVDLSLGRIFRDDASVLGVTFPAHTRRAEHTATRQNPTWSPYGKTSAAILARLKRGEIGAEEAIDSLKALSSPQDNAEAFVAVRLWKTDDFE
jgi:hypothetical protein